MQYTLALVFFNLILGAVIAQQPPGAEAPPPLPMPPQFQQMEQARHAAAAEVSQALTAADRARVNGVIVSFNRGDLSMCEAAENVDGFLSGSEKTQILAQEQQLRASFPRPPAMHGAPPPGAAFQEHMRRKPDAGEVVVMLMAMP